MNSDSSEGLFQSDSQGKSICKISVKGSSVQSSPHSIKRFSATHEDLDVIMKGFSTVLDMRRGKDCDHTIYS